MRASTKRALSLLGTAFIFVAALATYALFLKPAYNEVNIVRGELAVRSQIFNDKSAIISRVRDLLVQYQGTARIQDAISMTLPQQENAAAITNQLSGIAAASGLIIQSMSLQQQALRPSDGGDEAAKAVGVSEINLRLLGSYEAFKFLIQAVETNIRLMDVVSVRVESPSRTVSSNNLNFNLVINAYYQSE